MRGHAWLLRVLRLRSLPAHLAHETKLGAALLWPTQRALAGRQDGRRIFGLLAQPRTELVPRPQPATAAATAAGGRCRAVPARPCLATQCRVRSRRGLPPGESSGRRHPPVDQRDAPARRCRPTTAAGRPPWRLGPPTGAVRAAGPARDPYAPGAASRPVGPALLSLVLGAVKDNSKSPPPQDPSVALGATMAAAALRPTQT